MLVKRYGGYAMHYRCKHYCHCNQNHYYHQQQQHNIIVYILSNSHLGSRESNEKKYLSGAVQIGLDLAQNKSLWLVQITSSLAQPWLGPNLVQICSVPNWPWLGTNLVQIWSALDQPWLIPNRFGLDRLWLGPNLVQIWSGTALIWPRIGSDLVWSRSAFVWAKLGSDLVWSRFGRNINIYDWFIFGPVQTDQIWSCFGA